MTVREFKQCYFSFNGRLNRKPFFMRLMMLGALGIFFVLLVISVEPALKADPKNFSSNIRNYVIFWVYYIPLVIASISLGVRRLHDLNMSPWWLLLGSGVFLNGLQFGDSKIDLAAALLFYISQLFNAFLLLKRGTKGPNRYGEDPVAIAKEKDELTKKEKAKARKTAAQLAREAEAELDRQIAEAHPDWDEYERYEAKMEAKEKQTAEKKAQETAANDKQDDEKK